MAAMPPFVRCPICRQEARWEKNPFRPFCSERCKLQDLGAWATERYRVEGESVAQPADGGDGHDADEDDDGE